jgi:ring-1,2-phenylacetyl-CoA epoxidase subunit PaaE
MIENITHETADAVTIHLTIQQELASVFEFRSGQYITVRFMLDGKEQRRSYSMSSAPHEHKLSFTVKKVKNGIVSTHICENLKIGETIECMPPEGKFVLTTDFDKGKTYYFIAAGSGITPVLSHIKTLLEQEPQSTLFLFYGNRNEQSIIFRQQLDSLMKFYSGQLYVDHILSQPKREKSSGLSGLFSKGTLSWQGKTGRINTKSLDLFMQDYPARNKEIEYIICGPGKMIDEVTQYFLDQKIDKKRIHREYFSVDVTPDHASDLTYLESNLIVHLDGETIEATVPAGKTILETLVSMKKNPPYSCTSGACSTCMAKLIVGQVEMKVCHALDEDEIAKGYILTCQARPVTANIEIDYNA